GGQGGCFAFGLLDFGVAAELGVLDFIVQLIHGVDQHFGPRWAAGQVHVYRHDVVDALHDGVVAEHAAAPSPHAHRQDVFGIDHLVVDRPQHRRHLIADAAGHDHQIGLAR